MTADPFRDEATRVVLVGGELRGWSDWPEGLPEPGPLVDFVAETMADVQPSRVLLVGPVAAALASAVLSRGAEVSVVLRSLDDARRGAELYPEASWFAGAMHRLPTRGGFDLILLLDDVADISGSDDPDQVLSMGESLKRFAGWLTPAGQIVVRFSRWNSLDALLNPQDSNAALERTARFRGAHLEEDALVRSAGLAVRSRSLVWPTLDSPRVLTRSGVPLTSAQQRSVVASWARVDPRGWLRDPLRVVLGHGGRLDDGCSAGSIAVLTRDPEQSPAPSEEAIRDVDDAHADVHSDVPQGLIAAGALHAAFLDGDLVAARALLQGYARWLREVVPPHDVGGALLWRVVVGPDGAFSSDPAFESAPSADPDTVLAHALLQLAHTHVDRGWPGPWESGSDAVQVVEGLAAMAGAVVTPAALRRAQARAEALYDQCGEDAWSVGPMRSGRARVEAERLDVGILAVAAERAAKVAWLENRVEVQTRELRSLRLAVAVESSAPYRLARGLSRVRPGMVRLADAVRERVRPKE